MDNFSLIGFIGGSLFGFFVWSRLRGPQDPLDPAKLSGAWAICSGIVGALLLVVLLAYPLTLEAEWPHSLGHVLLQFPVAAAFLGVIFGGVAPEWLRFIVLPVRLKTEELRAAHTRWAYVLITLLVVGIVYPVLPVILSWISEANITTPVLTVSLTPHLVSEPGRDGNAPPASNAQDYRTRSPAPPERFSTLDGAMERDAGYTALFLEKDDSTRKFLEPLHAYAKKRFPEIIASAGSCIRKYFGVYHDTGMVADRTRKFLITYTKAVHERIPASGAVLADLETALSGIESDIPSRKAAKETCAAADGKVKEAMNNAPELDFVLPYTALGLSYALFSAGLTDQAAVEVARWLDERFPAEDSSSKVPPLPLWYKIRGLWELSIMLETSSDARSRIRALDSTIHAYEALFEKTKIGSAKEWMKRCSRLKYEFDDEQIRLQEQLVISYLGTIDKWLYHTTRQKWIVREDHASVVTQQMLYYAEENKAANLDCFPQFFAKNTTRPDEYLGSYLVQYGTVLAAYAYTLRHDSDSDRRLRSKKIDESRLALERAIELLKPVANEARPSTAHWVDELFNLSNAAELLRDAREALADVNNFPK